MSLPESAYGAELTIDLAAIAENWRRMKALAGAAECGAVIKADAYGCGIEQVAPALWEAGCRTFFVAHLSEGARARAALPDAAIYVLNGLLPDSAPVYGEHRLRPVLGCDEDVAQWSSGGGGAPCAVHVDTGMNRLGFPAREIARSKAAGLFADLKPALVMTHFSASEVPDDPANRRQIELFQDVPALFPDAAASLLNSSGHFLPDAPRLDLTRPGVALYGGNPTPGRPNPMTPAVTLRARILQVREVPDGEGVGYNSRWHAKGARKLATINVGYADGYPRNGSFTDETEGGYAMVGGVKCPFAGTVSMDLVIVDVTDAPDAAVRAGEWATLIGDGLDVDSVGAGAKTIGYEILTGLGRRHRRRHVG